MSSNSVCNHTHDKQIRLPVHGRPILLSLVWLQTELDSTQSYYRYTAGRLLGWKLFFQLDNNDNRAKYSWFDKVQGQVDGLNRAPI